WEEFEDDDDDGGGGDSDGDDKGDGSGQDLEIVEFKLPSVGRLYCIDCNDQPLEVSHHFDA
ncbi:hypothetical protein WUBG_04415, partial [Wuchereria bancrofti]